MSKKKDPMDLLVGMVMKKTEGKADPALVRKILEEMVEKTFEEFVKGEKPKETGQG